VIADLDQILEKPLPLDLDSPPDGFFLHTESSDAS